MTLRSRILLIVGGVLAFAAMGPLILFYARGYHFDFEQKRFVRTGVLVVDTDPRGADLFLNEAQLTQTTPFVRRFMVPGQYLIRIEKPGYRPWRKTVLVGEQAVTKIPGDTSHVFLLLAEPPSKTIATDTTDFLTVQNDLYYLRHETVYRATFEDSGLAIVATSTTALARELLPLLPGPEASYYIDPQTRRLMISSPTGDIALLAAPLPAFNQSQIIALPNRQVFLLLDQDLYEVGVELKKINGGVTYVQAQDDLPGLLYGNRHEVWLYDVGKQKNLLLTSSTVGLGEAFYHKQTGYLFVAEGQQIKAIEVTMIGRPNVYVLAETKDSLPKLAVNPQGTILLYLDGGELVNLKIR